jgi:isoquinoline 1-oxidoreductase subunit alpha
MSYTITINGKPQTVDVDGDTPLLWVLRDVLDMKGPKFGCGLGLCGCCTVHIDGTARRACVTPISAIGARPVTTIEGVGDTETGKKVQAAWLDLDVMQCGYCQAGQIMAAADLLARNPNPSDEDISKIPNLCRCGTYPRIRRAIKRAAQIAREESR